MERSVFAASSFLKVVDTYNFCRDVCEWELYVENLKILQSTTRDFLFLWSREMLLVILEEESASAEDFTAFLGNSTTLPTSTWVTRINLNFCIIILAIFDLPY
jgi:hypothetical protein